MVDLIAASLGLRTFLFPCVPVWLGISVLVITDISAVSENVLHIIS